MEQWPVLQKFWQRTLPDFTVDADGAADSWLEETRHLQNMGIATEAALQFLYFQRPDWDGFKAWLRENRREQVGETEEAAEDVLDAGDLAFWEENGYVVLKNAVPEEQCDAARQAIWEFLQASPDDPSSWYRAHEARAGLMVKFFDHPALDANRDSARIRNAYRQLYGSEAIFKVIDKVSFNPPERDGFRFVGTSLHWDVSLVLPIPFRLQGLLYLTDCTAEDGAFHCVPGFHRRIGQWLGALPPDAEPRKLAPQVLQSVPVPGKAGDFIIWHQALPHCATPNRGCAPRLVQYLTYLPEAGEEQKVWL